MIRFALPTGVLVFVGASTPWIAQRVPRFLFPAVAAAGAALVVFSLVSSLVWFVRRYRGEGRLRVFPVVVNVIAMVFLVILPLTHLVRAMTPSGDGAPRILVGFGDWLGSEGYPRLNPHRGIDVAGRLGADVLAAADGRVTVARDNRAELGSGLAIQHELRPPVCHV
jgi:amino acid transporter